MTRWVSLGQHWVVSVASGMCIFVVLLVLCGERSILLRSPGLFTRLDLPGSLDAAFALNDDVFRRSGRFSAEWSSCVPA